VVSSLAEAMVDVMAVYYLVVAAFSQANFFGVGETVDLPSVSCVFAVKLSSRISMRTGTALSRRFCFFVSGPVGTLHSPWEELTPHHAFHSINDISEPLILRSQPLNLREQAGCGSIPVLVPENLNGALKFCNMRFSLLSQRPLSLAIDCSFALPAFLLA